MERVPTVGNEVEIGVDLQAWEPGNLALPQEVLDLPIPVWRPHVDEHQDHLRMLQQILQPPLHSGGLDFSIQPREPVIVQPAVALQERLQREPIVVVRPPQYGDDNARPAELDEALENLQQQIEQEIQQVQAANQQQQQQQPPLVIIDDDSDNEVQVEHDQEEIERVKKKLKLDIKTEERPVDDEDDDPDSGRLCPICMDYWSNSGEHRLCSLRCGHLFGHSCVLKWLQVACAGGSRRCPQCNKKAAVKDIRLIYASNVAVIDTVEIDLLKKQLLEMTAEKNRVEMELSKCHLRQRMCDDQITNLTRTIRDLEQQKFEMTMRINENVARQVNRKFHLERGMEICKEGGCRVLGHNPFYNCLAVTQKSGNALFSGYGVKKIDVESFEPMQFVLLHNQVIRDLAFHPLQQALLLSVSFDKTAKLMDIRNNLVVHGYPLDGQVWSCCWSGDNQNIFHAGTQNGSIMQFDIRQTAGAVDTLGSPGDRSPVVSLASVPPNSAGGIIRGGFLATHLNTCYAYEQSNSIYMPKQMFLDGPFVSIRYDAKNNHALISSRPNARHPNARHVVLSVEKGNEEAILCNIVHTFNAGNAQKLLSRPCHITTDEDTLIAMHNESSSCVPLWSVSTGRQVASIAVSDPVLDMCSFNINNSCFLTTLSAKKLRVYKYGQIS